VFVLPQIFKDQRKCTQTLQKPKVLCQPSNPISAQRDSSGHVGRPASAFLDSSSNDFGIVNALALAGRPLLTGRSLSKKRPDAKLICLPELKEVM
jgi:hypothetical protein